MKLQCVQEALAEALGIVGRAVPARTTLPVLSNVLVEADTTDGLQVVASNLELTISHRLAAAVSEAGRTTVPARLLADYVALLDRGKQVSLKLPSSGTRLHLTCDRYEANIATLPANNFPATPSAPGNTRLEVDGAVLKTAIEQVVFAAAPDETRPVLAVDSVPLGAATQHQPRRWTEYTIEVSCLLCSRLLGHVVSRQFPPPSVVLLRRVPERTMHRLKDWRHLRCWHCGGNAVLGEVDVRVSETPYDWTADRPRRGRPPRRPMSLI